MTIVSETTKQTFGGNGAQTVFAYTFLLPTAAQYQLYYVNAAGVIELVSQVNYTVSGVGNPAGGNVTYTRGGSPIATGTSITLTRAIPYTQTTSLRNQGAYYPTVIEAALDRLDMQVQQLHSTMELTVRAPITNSNMAELPTASERAGKWAIFDAEGDLTATDDGPTSPFGSLEVTGAQDILANPVANPLDTYTSMLIEGETIKDNNIEMLAVFGFVSNKGEAAAALSREKVTLYAGLRADDGTGDVWAFNTVTTLESGAAAYNAYGYELDFNNLNGHRGDTAGAGGLAAPIGYGLAVTGVSTYRSTSAVLVNAYSATWNRGITIAGGIVQSAFQDFSLGDRSIDLLGIYDYAIDLTGSFASAAAVLIGSQQYVEGQLADGTTEVTMLGIDGTDQILLGHSGANVAVYSPALVPAADNVVSLGITGRRWTEVWAANGTIQTSDLRSKTDPKPLPRKKMLELVREVEPISFKFKQGGGEKVTRVERQMAQVYETVDVVQEVPVVRDGVATLEKRITQRRQRVADEVPVVDESGQQIIDWTKPVRGRGGRIITPSQPVPRTHRVPRMAMQDAEVEELVPRPGRRTHYGFAAGAVQEAMLKLGLGDVGVFVRGEDGVEGLRHDQLVAVLWQGLRELDAKHRTLKKTVGKLKSTVAALSEQR